MTDRALALTETDIEPARFGPWRDDRRGVDDGYSGASLAAALSVVVFFGRYDSS